jgi:DNA-binding NarL/FixJ family response regulator
MPTVMFVRPANAGQVDVPWPRVLLADGDASGTQALRHSLIQLGFDVVGTVSPPLTAFETALALKPDVILLEAGSPGGLEALQRVRRYLPETHIVVVRASDEIETVDDAIVDAWGAGRGRAYAPARLRDEYQATRRAAAASASSKPATSTSVRSPHRVHAHAMTSVSPAASSAA